ncbi:MAG TPA: hypothetical protein VE547_01160 [Mycobacteriales bacterium]|nr:hypothetical protein [Mycobacteriales bacterium]
MGPILPVRRRQVTGGRIVAGAAGYPAPQRHSRLQKGETVITDDA